MDRNWCFDPTFHIDLGSGFDFDRWTLEWTLSIALSRSRFAGSRFANLRKMQVHRFTVAGRQDQGRALALLGADGAEDVGGSGPLVARRAGASDTSCPAARDFILLTDAGFVSKPFLWCRSRCACRVRPSPDGQQSLFKILDRACRLSMVERSGGELAVAHAAALTWATRTTPCNRITRSRT
jgi:hypothetical protein